MTPGSSDIWSQSLQGFGGGLMGGGSGSLGSLGRASSKLIDSSVDWLKRICWVAREVFGEEDDRWMQFRTWMCEHSPDWFFNLYSTHGEKFARWIRNKPFIKGILKMWMIWIIRRNYGPIPGSI
jgi:hypothetical protein